jgi:tetratricopeptide (TPR) repeat protein
VGAWHWLENLPSELGYGIVTSAVIATSVWGYRRARHPRPGLTPNTGDPRSSDTPRNLPPAPRRFVNRQRELQELDRVLERAGASPAVQVAIVSGMRGVGKSAIGSAWAHARKDKFVDGMLTGDFSRRRSPAGVSVSDVLADFLGELGTSDGAMPSTLAERRRLFERLTRDRRMLIVLDDVDLPAQAQQLLPSGAGSIVLVTSAHRLEELVRDGAQPVIVDPLDDHAARSLLYDFASGERAASDETATQRVLEACGGLPIALCVCGARLATHPDRSIGWLAEQLQQQTLLRTLSPTGEFNASAVFTSAYHDLRQGEAFMYRRLAAHTGADFAPAAAAAAAGLDLGAANRLLEELEEAYLLQEMGDGRYRAHELVRAHMAAIADNEEPESSREEASARVIDWYTAAARHADHAVTDERLRLGESEPAEAEDLPSLDGPNAAFSWFSIERFNVLDAQRAALERELYERVWQIAEALWPLCASHKRFTEWVSSHEAGVSAGEALGDQRVIARMRSQLARAYAELGRHAEARKEMDLALDAVERTSDERLGASVVEFDGVCRLRAGELAPALAAFGAARDAFQRVGVPRGVALQDYHIGWALVLGGDDALALEPLDRAERAMREIGDEINVGRALIRKGEALKNLGYDKQARTALSEALASLESAGVEFEQAEAHEALAVLAERDSDTARARVHRQRACRLYRKLGHPRAEELREMLETADAA